MRKVSRAAGQKEQLKFTIGLDFGDRFSHHCMLNRNGDAIDIPKQNHSKSTQNSLRF